MRGNLYVDKTEDIHRMITTDKIYFLSRPRRFGKSLLVNTLEAVFQAQKELFEGLYIYDKWDWNEKFPVIHLDFGAESYSTVEELKLSLNDFVEGTAQDNKISLQKHTLPGKFNELIKKLCESTGQKVVVLIDEYDKPITDHLSNLKVMKANKTALHNFYQVLKATDKYIKFIFLTGVSKFSGLSVFSALNNIRDITLSKEYVSICGYTQDELEKYFTEHIDNFARCENMSRQNLLNKIKKWYNGYSWDGETFVYNPFSTLLLFAEKEFDNYWFNTGTPTFLIELLKSRNRISPILGPVPVGSKIFKGYDPVTLNEFSLLFQTGYLTIKDIKDRGTDTDDDTKKKIYILDIPNLEVRDSFMEDLLSSYTAYPSDQIQLMIPEMKRQIFNSDTAGLQKNLTKLLADIPYILHVKNGNYYHSMFVVWMTMLGFEPQNEVMTDKGCIDSVLHHADTTVVVEVKYSAKKGAERLLNEAMKQINDRKYYEKYSDRKVILMAVAFAGKEVKCRLEELEIK
jgi:Holliday junction resolvase-like predicted endonuclease